MVLPSVNTAEAEHPTSLVIEEGVEQHPEAPWASRKRFQTTTRCISKKSSNTNAFWEANTPPRWGLQASDLHHDGAFMWLDETCSWPHHSADQQLQLQMMSLNLSSVHDLQPQHAFQLRGRKAMHFSHMDLFQLLLWPSLNFEHKKHKKHGVFNMQLLWLSSSRKEISCF